MKKYIKALSLVLALTSSVYLPSVFAANSTNMLITIAETNPVLIERLDDIALNDQKLLNQLLNIADSDAEQLERLLNLADTNPFIFEKLVTIKSLETAQEIKIEKKLSPYGQVSVLGTISVGDIIRN